MPAFDPHLWRLAGRIQQRIASLPREPIPSLEQSLWLSLRRFLDRRNGLAHRPWHVARENLTRQLVFTLGRLQDQLQHLHCCLADEGQVSHPTQRFLYEELLATREEFPDFEIDLQKNTVSVSTDEITLEGIELGRFRVQLDIPDLSRGRGYYRVTARSPNRAASRDDATHPHVLDNQLCEGEGAIPLQMALRTGRLSDFFLIVDRTLHTYNADSAYVSLRDWEDQTTCECCGDSVPDYNRSFCDACEHDTCDECSTSCTHCGRSACDRCIQCCPECDQQACDACLTPCRTCQGRCCPDCHTDSLCEDCHAIETNDEATEPTFDSPGATVQPDRLDEVAVPA